MKSTAKYKAFLATLALLLATGSAMAGEPDKPAATSTVVEEITVTPARVVIPQEWRVLSRAAAAILRHIADARGDIAQNETKAALKELDKIGPEVALIKDGRPVAVIEDHIRIAKKHLEYEKTTRVADDLIPIASDLTLLEDIIPVARARQHLAAVRKHLQSGNRKAAGRELAALEEVVGYTEVDLPLAETVRRVQKARTYLKDDRLKEADEQLKAAEEGVQVISLAVEGPVEMAGRHLQQAKIHHRANRDEAARADLENARAWIMRARQSGDRKVQEQAAQLDRAVQALAEKLQ
ncbi:YfdX family protein [Thermodesulfobacteriota bacterium B35]